MAEVIKAGVICDADLFSTLEGYSEGILSLDPRLVLSIVIQAVRIKAKVVTEDEKEGGIRAILNFGHSVGHGVEALLQPEYLHGEVSFTSQNTRACTSDVGLLSVWRLGCSKKLRLREHLVSVLRHRLAD